MAEAVAAAMLKDRFPFESRNVRIVGTDFKVSDMISDKWKELNMILDSKRCGD